MISNIVICVIFVGALAGLMVALIAPPIYLPSLDFSLLYRKEGTLPDTWLKAVSLLALIVTLLAAVFFWVSIKWLTADVQAKLLAAKADAVAPVNQSAKEAIDRVQQAVEYYAAQGFVHRGGFESEDGSHVILLQQAASDDGSFWQKDGALVYSDGRSVRFSVGILYSEDSWAYNSEHKVQRQRLGRPVSIETALKNPLVRELADRNDFLLTIGLASNKDGTGAPEYNDRLAGARAYNLGYASYKVKLKPIDRINWFHLGFANDLAPSEALEAVQRSAIIIGTVANRQVMGRDVVIGSMKLIDLRGVNLSRYSRTISGIVPKRDLDPSGGYRNVSDMAFVPGAVDALIYNPADPPGESDND